MPSAAAMMAQRTIARMLNSSRNGRNDYSLPWIESPNSIPVQLTCSPNESETT